MSQLRHPQTHRCQIDCTNHEEVITGLQLKSKELYYFWRNYEWLYARYQQSLMRDRQPEVRQEVVKEVVTVKEGHDRCNKEIEELEGSNERLTKQNKKLKMDLETCRKQIHELENNNRYEVEYKKEVTFLKNKNTELEGIKDKQLAEINKLKAELKKLEEEAETQRARLVKENKKLTQTIIELQQSIDDFRSRPQQVQTSTIYRQQGPSLLQLQEFKSKQTTILTSRLKSLSQQAERLLSVECDSMRRQFQQRFEETLFSLTQRQLQSIIQIIEQ